MASLADTCRRVTKETQGPNGQSLRPHLGGTSANEDRLTRVSANRTNVPGVFSYLMLPWN